jgi:hypothetical protein
VCELIVTKSSLSDDNKVLSQVNHSPGVKLLSLVVVMAGIVVGRESDWEEE